MSDKNRVPGLLDEQPIVVYPNLAVKIGINAAIILQQLHFLVNTTKAAKNTHNLIDGQWWVYNSYEQWRTDHFPWLSKSTIKNVFLDLEKKGVVVSMQSVKNKSDRRKWYTIDYDAWVKFYTPETDHETKIVPSNVQKLSDGYSDTTPETTKEQLPIASPIGNADGGSNDEDESVPVKTDTFDPYVDAEAMKAQVKRSESLKPDEPKPKKERKRDVIFDAVALGSFELEDVNGDKTAGARIGKVASWLKKQSDVTPEKIISFYTWYDRENPNCNRPKDVGKFAEHWLKWVAAAPKSVTGVQASFETPEPLPTLTPAEKAEADAFRAKMMAERKKTPPNVTTVPFKPDSLEDDQS